MLHYLLDFFEWLLARAHPGLCRVGLHQWSFTYAHSWDDLYLWRQCVVCKCERQWGKQWTAS